MVSFMKKSNEIRFWDLTNDTTIQIEQHTEIQGKGKQGAEGLYP